MKLHTSDRLSCKNDKANLKIVSWNVNGIRAWLTNHGMKYVEAEQPDIICFQVEFIDLFFCLVFNKQKLKFLSQELKCDKEKIPKEATPNGYKAFWLSGDQGNGYCSYKNQSIY